MTTDTNTAPEPFDLAGPLPRGTTVLEASAGTGKTHAIVGVAARHIADGLPIDELLLVTFSRSASAELRERMRDRLTGLVAGLVTDPAEDDQPDSLLAALRTGTRDEVRERCTRLTRALSDFDAATIATTHTFCNRMLEALGFLGEREQLSDLVEDTDDLVAETARDLYLAAFAGRQDEPPFSMSRATQIATDAMRNPGVTLAPDPDAAPELPVESDAALRVRFCRAVREQVSRRKRIARLRTYDDLQLLLYDIVTDPDFGEMACDRIRSAFRLILVDEFQDTDPFQWEILRRCFHGHRQLVLVGDPKQSIYAFRGAEVLSYLAAVAEADQVRALDTNWRSDADLVDSLYSLYGGAGLGHPQIVVHPVQAARPGSRLSGAPAIRVRAFTRRDFATKTAGDELVRVDVARERVVADVAADIARLLGSDTRIDTAEGPREIRPGDIAVLTRTNKTIVMLQRELTAQGVGSVVGGGMSVFATPAASHWLWLIRAVESPARSDRVRMAALTPLIGRRAADLADTTDAELAELAAFFGDLGRVFRVGGFAAMAQRLLAAREVPARVLADDDGERSLTDLLQISSLCNRHVMDTDCGLTALAEWLNERIDDDSKWRRHEDQTRKLDRDTQVVQIMTVHGSKGLQFPIVYAPFGWDYSHYPRPETFRYHDDAGIRHLDVGGDGTPGRPARLQRSADEDAREELRLLYVALTRAASQVVLWWLPATMTHESPLHRLIFGHDCASGNPNVPLSVPVPTDVEAVARLRSFASCGRSIEVEPAGREARVAWSPHTSDTAPPALDVATFGRIIDHGWRRTSYSAIITGAAHQHALVDSGSEPDGGVVDDEPGTPLDDDPAASVEPDEAAGGTPSPMNGLPYGAAFGTLVHEVLEYVDTSRVDREQHVRELCAEAVTRQAAAVDADTLAAALHGVLSTPLGFGTLWDVAPPDRLAEVDFEIPLGDRDSGPLLADIAALMAEHLEAGDDLYPYVGVLADLPRQELRGFLTGSIDSVLRIPDGRFVIVDYKTNRLGPGPRRAEDFSRPEMAAEMIRSHYPLQALLYSVALHRYLRWRLPGYRPDEHLGPVQYHFVRGMVGPATPVGCGVFEWSVPAELVAGLSDLLAGAKR